MTTRTALPLMLILILSSWPWQGHAKVEPRSEEDAITPQPKVTIVQSQDKELQVHEVNGRIYGIKVIPSSGEPYFLIDTAGDGNFVRSPADRMRIPEWVLIRW